MNTRELENESNIREFTENTSLYASPSLIASSRIQTMSKRIVIDCDSIELRYKKLNIGLSIDSEKVAKFLDEVDTIVINGVTFLKSK